MNGGGGKCHSCHQEIFGGPVKIGHDLYHTKFAFLFSPAHFFLKNGCSCFVCHLCKRKLQMTTYTLNNDRLYCQACFKARFLRDVDASHTQAPMSLGGGAAAATCTAETCDPCFRMPTTTGGGGGGHSSTKRAQAIFGGATPSPQPAPEASARTKRCPGCAAEMPADARFCMSCGKSFLP